MGSSFLNTVENGMIGCVFFALLWFCFIPLLAGTMTTKMLQLVRMAEERKER